jgi:hypothetical protein
MLKQIKTINESWIAIIDHSIDIGIKLVFGVFQVAPLINSKSKLITILIIYDRVGS